MALVKQYNNGKSTEFDLEQLNNVLEPGIYTIKTEAVSTLGNKSKESNGIEYRVIGPGVKIGNYTYRTTLIGLNDILKAGDNLVNYDEKTSTDENLYAIRNGKYYFSYSAIKYLNENAETIFPGWHIPTMEEFVDMLASKNITIGSYYEEHTILSDVETDLKEILNQVGFDTTTWDENCGYDYSQEVTLEEDYLLCTNEFDSIHFNSSEIYWANITSYTDYWPQLILCKNHD